MIEKSITYLSFLCILKSEILYFGKCEKLNGSKNTSNSFSDFLTALKKYFCTHSLIISYGCQKL